MKNKGSRYLIVSSLVFVLGVYGFLNLSFFIVLNKSLKLIITLVLIAFIIFISVEKFKKFNLLKKSVIFILSIVLSYMIIYRNEISIMYKISKGELILNELSNNNKKIVLIDLYHISTKKYFDKLNDKLDSLARLDYVLLYEKITDTVKGNKSLEEKWQKFIGGPSTEKEYEKLVKNNPYLQVQKTNSLVSKFKISENIDLSKTLLVKQYENLKGEIKTDSKIDENSFKKLMYTARENHIAYELNNSCHEKIVAIYGSSHRKNIINLLKNEYNWNITKIIKY